MESGSVEQRAVDETHHARDVTDALPGPAESGAVLCVSSSSSDDIPFAIDRRAYVQRVDP